MYTYMHNFNGQLENEYNSLRVINNVYKIQFIINTKPRFLQRAKRRNKKKNQNNSHYTKVSARLFFYSRRKSGERPYLSDRYRGRMRGGGITAAITEKDTLNCTLLSSVDLWGAYGIISGIRI